MKAYVDLASNPDAPYKTAAIRLELQSSGISLTDCPSHNGRNHAIEMVMLVDILAYVIDNPRPLTIVLICGDRDFGYAISTLRLRGHRVVLISLDTAQAGMKAQASEHLDWYSEVLRIPADAAADIRAPVNTGNIALQENKEPPPQPQVNQEELNRSSVKGAERVPNNRNSAMNQDLLLNRSIRSHEISQTTDTRTHDLNIGKFIQPSVVKPKVALMPLAVTLALKEGLAKVENGVRNEPNPVSFDPTLKWCGDKEYLKSLGILKDQPSTSSYHSSNHSLSGLGSDQPPEREPSPSPPVASKPRSTPHTGTLNRIQVTSPDIRQPSKDLRDVSPIPRSPERSHSSTPANSSSPQPIPLIYIPLVESLRFHRSKGLYSPLRSSLAATLSVRNPGIYLRAGVKKFAQYAAMAEKAGIIELGGKDGAAWIALRPEWYSGNTLSTPTDVAV
ncbi:hypothetical protein H0H87_005238 [Tephrocybe sp. NHM501043]|nr:hypothetical protein H0H87_005238 [Tephrocybe sp. NHM501043]